GRRLVGSSRCSARALPGSPRRLIGLVSSERRGTRRERSDCVLCRIVRHPLRPAERQPLFLVGPHVSDRLEPRLSGQSAVGSGSFPAELGRRGWPSSGNHPARRPCGGIVGSRLLRLARFETPYPHGSNRSDDAATPPGVGTPLGGA